MGVLNKAKLVIIKDVSPIVRNQYHWYSI